MTFRCCEQTCSRHALGTARGHIARWRCQPGTNEARSIGCMSTAGGRNRFGWYLPIFLNPDCQSALSHESVKNFFYALVSLTQTQGGAPNVRPVDTRYPSRACSRPGKAMGLRRIIGNSEYPDGQGTQRWRSDFTRAPRRARWISNRTRLPVDDGCAGTSFWVAKWYSKNDGPTPSK